MRGNWSKHLDADKDPENDETYRLADEHLTEEIAAYRDRYLNIWRANRGALMYATTDNQRSGISVILPVSNDAYERLRDGNISFMDVKAEDVRPRSSNIIIDSAVEFEHVRDRRWFEIADSLSFLMFFQIATLSRPMDNQFRMLSFAASRTNSLRLQSIGFSLSDTRMPDLDLRICEFTTDHSDVWNELDERTSNTAHFAALYRRWSTTAKLRAKRKFLVQLLRSYQWVLGVAQREEDSAA